ncbi:hypothetical protein QJS10_CPB22g00975 [Acorus calamus]|uniref:Uncharacterized protein n=1 Tax=Acorus calamus TaxID=4465 RepID=A0AAV9C022_ACOCL|nr:hypothetical protein QJS10_CPB22g00975 [Acorus calamus]
MMTFKSIIIRVHPEPRSSHDLKASSAIGMHQQQANPACLATVIGVQYFSPGPDKKKSVLKVRIASGETEQLTNPTHNTSQIEEMDYSVATQDE